MFNCKLFFIDLGTVHLVWLTCRGRCRVVLYWTGCSFLEEDWMEGLRMSCFFSRPQLKYWQKELLTVTGSSEPAGSLTLPKRTNMHQVGYMGEKNFIVNVFGIIYVVTLLDFLTIQFLRSYVSLQIQLWCCWRQDAQRWRPYSAANSSGKANV